MNEQTKEQIIAIALANGFKLKEQPDGSMALNPYVFDFANALSQQKSKVADSDATAAPVVPARIGVTTPAMYGNEQPQQSAQPVAWLYKGTGPHTQGKLIFQEDRATSIETRWWVELGPVYLHPQSSITQPDVPAICFGNIVQPVAWALQATRHSLDGHRLDDGSWDIYWDADCNDAMRKQGQPLYAAAQPVEVQRVGLTDEDILRIDCMSDRTWVLLFARAIEAAHGIKPASEGGA